MKACIINIGNELLDGKISNANAEFIMNELATIGIPVERQMIVADDKDEIKKALDFNKDYDLILTTGGLGTTDDDKSRETVEEYLLENKIDHDLIEMKNTRGMFPGVYYSFKTGGIMIFPGPPREMNTMLRNNLDLLVDEDLVTIRKTYRISFLREHIIHDILREHGVATDYVNTFIDSDQSAYLKLYMEDTSEEILRERFEKIDKIINEIFYPLIYTNEDITREQNLVKELLEKNMTLSCAESYTGGKIISSLIEIPDTSKIIDQAYIVYNDEAKEEILKVSPSLIKEHGVVSKEVCGAMLDGLYDRSKSDICIATTGYAGPTGDVGNVYFGIRYKGKNHIFKKYMKYSRRWIMNKSKNYVVDYTHLIINDLLDQAKDILENDLG
ncbi:MAG: nicotinamide-nucleotide amidohydrolase family protein [Tissierellia bacterium]|nr:nicotinamide-nucleotide amidohydrolase family protein [Tissierellia bacterium]